MYSFSLSFYVAAGAVYTCIHIKDHLTWLGLAWCDCRCTW